MKEIIKDWDEFWAKVIGIKIYDTVENAEKCADSQVKHLIHALNLKKGDRILDLACGAGFHAVSLTEKGMKVTGVDVSMTLIQYAQEHASEKGVSVDFVQKDMRNIDFEGLFDTVCIFGFSFGFLDDEGNFLVLQKIREALKKGGNFYLQALNPLFDGSWRNCLEWARKDDGYWLLKSEYNPYTGRIEGNDLYIKDDGTIIKQDNDEVIRTRSIRLYTLPELSKMIDATGMRIKEVYGTQKVPLEKYNLRSPEMIVTGERI